MPQLTCDNLTIGYEGKAVICGLNFSINAGDYLCVTGENGSGKSTLIKTILKIKTPMAGRVFTDGGLSQNQIGYLPQQTLAQEDFPASVREVVLSGCLNRCGLRPFYNKAEKLMAEEQMQKLGIAHLAKCCYRELSGGQQRRALLARALCAASKILLLDEPAAGLDPKAAAEMYELTAKLNSGGITIIMISHDVAASVKYSSHILHIVSSTKQFFGKTAQFLKSDIGRAYVESGRIGSDEKIFDYVNPVKASSRDNHSNCADSNNTNTGDAQI